MSTSEAAGRGSIEIVDDIVLACRALTARGCDTGIGGHVSVRATGEDAFWINAFDRTLGEVTAVDVMKLDYDGNLLEGNREVSLGFEFHAGVYQHRSDVNSIVHSHGRWITALASLARPLKMRHNLCCIFHDDQVLSPDDRFESIGPAIETNHTVIIPWHGAITVGATLARAAALHATLEDQAQLDVNLEPTDAPEIPEHLRLGLKKLVDDQAGYLEQTWTLMRRQGQRHLDSHPTG